ncbi:CDP-alcohol phosphatidyltransferase family protein [Thermosulfurimonas sp.]|uniref:CDP-alcohol phosphatidyltransferase family protein n=1 Tax=Thermosulfurimonas sp. TaxID=2080236 RepID=UPI0025E1AC02|nr:CDP-alcohol phosphatidyltransferase family protein [Thermosulfurimonas sp.]
MVKLTPNRLTLLRIFLLPLPCVLLFGGPEAKLTAVGIGSLLGLTDYLDGRLARREGPSRLGRLLDPVADKIFVSVIYLLLYHLTYLPYLPVFLLLLREILIAGLRNLYPEGMRVWTLARIKTALQMLGAGGIVLAGSFLPHPWSSLLTQIIVWSVLILTWLSAWPYLREGFPALSRTPRRSLSLVFYLLPPLVLLLAFPYAGRFWLVILLALPLLFLADLGLSFCSRPAKGLHS